eukprot:gene2189-2330_t
MIGRVSSSILLLSCFLVCIQAYIPNGRNRLQGSRIITAKENGKNEFLRHLRNSNNDDLPTVSTLAANLKATAAKLRAEAAELEAAEKRLMVEKLSEIFDSFDTNKDGKISLEELKDGLTKLLSSSINEEQAKKIMDQFDTSGDGALQLEEFQAIEVFSMKFESILREERRIAEEAAAKAALAKVEAEKAEAITKLINNRPASALDRSISILPFLLPLLDALPFGKTLIDNFQLQGNPIIEFSSYLFLLYQNIPFAGLIAFILFNLLTNNLQLNRLVRYNIQLAIYLDIVLVFPGIFGAIADAVTKSLGTPIPQQITDGSSAATFIIFAITLFYATFSSLLGKEPDKLPYINDRIRERVPSTEEFQRMYQNYEELMQKREKDKKERDEKNNKK